MKAVARYGRAIAHLSWKMPISTKRMSRNVMPRDRARIMLSRRFVAIGGLVQLGSLSLLSSHLRAQGDTDILLIPKVLDLPTPVDGLIQLPTSPTLSRTTASRAVTACKAIVETSARTIKQLHAMAAGIEQGKEDIAHAIEEKQTVIGQLRKGFYCSRCNRSKFEIEATGENFAVHLNRVSGTEVPAPAAVIQQKEADFDARIERLTTEQRTRIQNFNRTKTYNAALHQQFQQGVLLWRTAILLEHGAVETQFKKADELDNKRLEAVRDVLKQLEILEKRLLQRLNGRDPLATARLQQNQDEQTSWNARIRPIENSIAARRRNFEPTMASLKQNANRDASELAAAAAEISGAKPFQLFAMPSFSIAYEKWNIAISADQAGVRFQFTAIIAGGVDSKFDTNARSAETVAFVELLSKVRIYAGTRWEFDGGTTSYPLGGIKRVDKPLPPDDGWKIDLPR